MITLIATRIEKDGSSAGGEKAYAKSLLAYMNRPENDEKSGEKCVAMMCRNFSGDFLSPDEMAAEMSADCSMSRRLQDGQGVDHWVVTYKCSAGEKLPIQKIFGDAERFMEEMGYGGQDEYKWSASIHADTDNIHCHIAVCRVNSLTGRVKPRGMDKRQALKAVVRIAQERKYGLEPGQARLYASIKGGQKDEVITKDCVTGKPEIRYRPGLIDVQTGERVLDDVAMPALRVKNRRGKDFTLPLTPNMAVEVAPELAEYERLLKQRMMRTEPDKITPHQLQGKVHRIPGPGPRHNSGKPGLHIGGLPADDLGFWDLIEALGAGLCEFTDSLIEIEPIENVETENAVSIIKVTGKSWSKVTKRLMDTRDLPPQLQSIIDKNTQYLQPQKPCIQTSQDFKLSSQYATAEAHQGIKSAQTLLHERLTEAYAQMEADLPRMKWGQIHKELAQYGIEMKRRQHKDRYGLVFSMDGKNWLKASDVFPKMSWAALNGNIGAKKDSWRDIREDAIAQLEAARKQIFNDNLLTEKSIQKLSRRGLAKNEIEALQKIPASVLRDVLAADDGNLSALEVLNHHMTAPEAMDFLARRFPVVVHDDASKIFDELGRQNPGLDKVPASQAAYDLINLWRVLQIDAMDIDASRRTTAAEIWQGEGIGRKKVLTRTGANLPTALACLPKLVKAAGFKPAPARIECRPVWGGGKTGIVLNNIKDRDFLDSYPPNVAIRNGEGSQIVWLVPRKYKEQKFYDDFGIWINMTFGGGTPGGTLMLPGLENAELLYAKIGSSGQLERLLDEFRADWVSGNSSETKNIRWQKISAVREKIPVGRLPEDFFENERYRNPDGSLREDLMDEFMFPKPNVSPELLKLGRQIINGLDFEDDDFVNGIAAEVLFEADADKNEVCSILQRYGRGGRETGHVAELVELVAPGYMVNTEWMEKEREAASKGRGRSFFTAGDMERRINQLKMRGIERMRQTVKTVERKIDSPGMGM